MRPAEAMPGHTGSTSTVDAQTIIGELQDDRASYDALKGGAAGCAVG